MDFYLSLILKLQKCAIYILGQFVIFICGISSQRWNQETSFCCLKDARRVSGQHFAVGAASAAHGDFSLAHFFKVFFSSSSSHRYSKSKVGNRNGQGGEHSAISSYSALAPHCYLIKSSIVQNIICHRVTKKES